MAGMFSAAYLGVLEGFYTLGAYLYYNNYDTFFYGVIALTVLFYGCNIYKNYKYMKMMAELNEKEGFEDTCCSKRDEVDTVDNLEP